MEGRDGLRRRERRRVTPAAVLAATIGTVGLALMITGYRIEAIVGLGFIPARVGGAMLPPEVAALPLWLTPLGTLFAFTDPVTLVFTCAILLVVGNRVEEVIGAAAMLAVLALGAYAGALAYWIEAPASTEPMTSGLMLLSAPIGAMAMLYGRSTRSRLVNALWLFAAWTAICVALSMTREGGLFPGWSVGIGGFLVGLALAPPLLAWRRRTA